MKVLSDKINYLLYDLIKCNDLINNKLNKLQNGGGNEKQLYKKLKKYKKNFKKSIKSIVYYRNMAENYMNSYNNINLQYGIMYKKLEDMKEKLGNAHNTIDMVNSKFDLNSEKIQMLESMMGMVEKIKGKKIDIEMISKLDSNGQINTNTAKINGNLYEDAETIQKQKGGSGKSDVFALEQQLLGLKDKADDSAGNIDFLDKKMADLNARMKTIIEDDENIFKLRAKIEWMVNKLEEVGEEDAQKAELDLNNIKKLVDEIQGKMNNSKEDKLVEYIHGLEKYISMLDAQTKSSVKTIESMSGKNLEEMNKHVDENVNTEQIAIGGASTFVKPINVTYINDLNKKIGNVINLVNSDLNTKIIITPLTELSKYDDIEKTTKLYNKLVVIVLLYENYKYIINELKQINTIFNITEFDKTYEYKDDILIKQLWDIAFKNKKTDYYTTLYNKKLYDLNEFKNITIDLFDDSKDTKYKKLIDDLHKNYSLAICIIYTLTNFIACFVAINTDNMNDLLIACRKIYSNMPKVITYEKNIIDVYDEKIGELTKINKATKIITILIEEYNKLTKTEPFTKLNFVNILNKPDELSENIKLYEDYNNIIVKESITQISKKEGSDDKKRSKTVVNNIVNNIGQVFNKYLDLSGIIKGKMPDSAKAQLTEEQYKEIEDTKEKISKLNTYGELYTIFEEITKSAETKTGGNKQITKMIKLGENGNYEIIQYGGAKIRLESFITKLTGAYTGINKTVPYIGAISNKLSELSKKDYAGKSDELDKIIAMFKNVINNFNDAQNSYIKVIPMIFFVVEFPPSIYAKKDSKYYKITHDLENYSIIYSQVPGLIYETDTDLVKKGDELNTSQTWKGAHMAFLESNGKNSTDNIMNDPMIGLNKIIESSSGNEYKIKNKVINMMFALGASGTGKTARYFGVPTATNIVDKQGIIPTLIKQAKDKDSKKKISFAYFVCYGRTIPPSSGSASATNNFVETLISFDIKKIYENKDVLCKFDDKDSTESKNCEDDAKQYHNYIKVYKMAKDTDETRVDKYSDFYKKIANKKLFVHFNDYKEDSTSPLITKYIIEKKDAINFLKGDNEKIVHDGTKRTYSSKEWEDAKKAGKTIKEIVTDNSSNFWMDVEDDTNLGDIFDNLINFQKKIFTVMSTRNNIESSRGHTCVLIRFGEDDNSTYFPLFDMAGTENILAITNFLSEIQGKITGTETEKKKKIAQLLVAINRLGTDRFAKDKKSQDYASLLGVYDDLENNTDLKTWLNPPLTSSGGGVTKTFTDLQNSTITKLENVVNLDKLVDKIAHEGNYINHTIAMIIFASLCVGYGMDSDVAGSAGTGSTSTGAPKDYYDEIMSKRNATDGTGILNKLEEKHICLTGNKKVRSSDSSGTDADSTCEKIDTKILLDTFNYNTILNNSCIWLHVLFTFLYWNEVDEDAKSILRDKTLKASNDTDINKYGKYVKDKFSDNTSQIANLEKITQILDIIIKNQIEFQEKNTILFYQTVGTKIDKFYSYIKYSIGTYNKFSVIEKIKNIMEETLLVNAIYTFLSKNLVTISSVAIMQIIVYHKLKYTNTFNNMINIKIDGNSNLLDFDQSSSHIKNIKESVQIKDADKKTTLLGKESYTNGFLHDSDIGNSPYNEIYEYLKTKSDIITFINTYKEIPFIGQLIQLLNTENDDFKIENNKLPSVKIIAKGEFKDDKYDDFKTKSDTVIDSINTIMTPEIKTLFDELFDRDITIFKSKVEAKIGEITKSKTLISKITNDIKDKDDIEINLVKDGFVSATKMTLMHLVTGQYSKKDMVNGTLNLVETLYEATDLNFN